MKEISEVLELFVCCAVLVFYHRNNHIHVHTHAAHTHILYLMAGKSKFHAFLIMTFYQHVLHTDLLSFLLPWYSYNSPNHAWYFTDRHRAVYYPHTHQPLRSSGTHKSSKKKDKQEVKYKKKYQSRPSQLFHPSLKGVEEQVSYPPRLPLWAVA